MAHSQSDTVHVFDTWVKGTKRLLHFDVMTTDEATALTLAKQHLASIGEGDVPVTVKECQFCHTEPLVMFSPEQQTTIPRAGRVHHHSLDLAGCGKTSQPQDAQKGRPARPQPMKAPEAYPLGYVEEAFEGERSWRAFSASC